MHIPTFDEALTLASGRVALCSELKDPEVYAREGVDILALYRAALDRHRAGAGHIVQSFHEATIRRAASLIDPVVRRVVLIEPPDIDPWLSAHRLTDAATFATVIGPGKPAVGAHPELVRLAQDAGLTVTPWTFRTRSCAPFPDVGAEMQHYLAELGVDGVITDEPDRYPSLGSSR